MINLPTKLEMPNFTGYGNMKVGANCRKWSGLGWLGVTLANLEVVRTVIDHVDHGNLTPSVVLFQNRRRKKVKLANEPSSASCPFHYTSISDRRAFLQYVGLRRQFLSHS